MPTVFRWHGEREFKCHFHFSFSHDTEKQIWILLFVFRFRLSLKNGFALRISFFVFASLWKTGINFSFRISFSHHFEKRIWISFLFFVFALLWKTDLNFVSRFLITLKNRSEFRLSFLHDLKKGSLHQSSHSKPRPPPQGGTGAFTFYVTESKWIFLSPGPTWVVNSPPPLQWYVLHTHSTPFLTMDDKWYDSREKTRSYRDTCISSMEKENDNHLNTLQLEVTRCEITKNYKSSFTVFWSFCRMTQSLQSVFLVVISRIQQITTS